MWALYLAPTEVSFSLSSETNPVQTWLTHWQFFFLRLTIMSVHYFLFFYLLYFKNILNTLIPKWIYLIFLKRLSCIMFMHYKNLLQFVQICSYNWKNDCASNFPTLIKSSWHSKKISMQSNIIWSSKKLFLLKIFVPLKKWRDIKIVTCFKKGLW